MAELEKKSGTITPAEEPTPHHGRGVDPASITQGDLHQNSKYGGKSRGMR